MYYYSEQEKLLQEEQNNADEGAKIVLKDCKKRHTNLSMAWIGKL